MDSKNLNPTFDEAMKDNGWPVLRTARAVWVLYNALPSGQFTTDFSEEHKDVITILRCHQEDVCIPRDSFITNEVVPLLFPLQQEHKRLREPVKPDDPTMRTVLAGMTKRLIDLNYVVGTVDGTLQFWRGGNRIGTLQLVGSDVANINSFSKDTPLAHMRLFLAYAEIYYYLEGK